MSPTATTSYSVAATITAVFGRLAETPWYGKVLGLAVGVLAAIRADSFIFILVVLMSAHAMDWWFGRIAAKARGEYSRDIATLGLHSKIAGIVLILLMRVIEAWLHDFSKAHVDGLQEYVNTGGILATAVAVALIVNDIESTMSHREAMGAKPIPVLSAIIAGLRRMANAMLPKGMREQ